MSTSMNTQPFEEYESQVRSYCRNFPTVFTTAKGSFLYDEDGKEYIDFFCGAGGLNYGHNNEYIKGKVLEYLQSDGVMHALDMYTAPKREFLEFYEEKILKPRGLNYKIQFPGPTGTNAVEAALKLARKVKGRNNVFAMMGGFHGMTLGSLALTTDASSRAGAGVPLYNVTHIPDSRALRDTIHYMETLLTDDHSGVEKPAAIVLETVQADGGINPFPVEWLQRVRALCDKYDILMIVDDIQVGCARTGWFFSFERAGIVPDIVTQSKSIGGYGMPFALVLIKPELDIWSPRRAQRHLPGLPALHGGGQGRPGGHCSTSTWRTRSAARRRSSPSTWTRSPPWTPARVRTRGIGFIWGVDLYHCDPEGKASKQVLDLCFQNGLIVERVGRGNAVVKVMPDLLIDEATLRRGLDILKSAVAQVLGK